MHSPSCSPAAAGKLLPGDPPKNSLKPGAQHLPSVEASQGALPKQAVEQILAEMSPREHEITELLKQGLANHDIAERLDLSDRTVQGHRNNIYKKLRVHNLKQFLTVLEGG